jgi:phage shock protein PspC (stress-responsive transcriptional regulator)
VQHPEKQKNYTEILKGISGVSAGLGHYFGIDAVWVRILLFY